MFNGPIVFKEEDNKIKATIYWIKNGFEDSANIEADTIDELREKANEIIEERKPEDYWSKVTEE